jgi:hypothetical protein
MGCAKKIEAQGFRPAVRLGRRHIRVYCQNDKMRTGVWSSYHMAKGILAPVQKMPKVGHFSVPKGER